VFFSRGLGDYCDAFEEGDNVGIDNLIGFAVFFMYNFSVQC
jgi:hypothetical protein